MAPERRTRNRDEFNPCSKGSREIRFFDLKLLMVESKAVFNPAAIYEAVRYISYTESCCDTDTSASIASVRMVSYETLITGVMCPGTLKC